MLIRNKTEDEQEVHLALGQVVDLSLITENIEKKYISAALKSSGNVRTTAADMLTMGSRQNLDNKMIKLKMLPSKDSKK